MQAMDVMCPVGAGTNTLFDAFDLEYFMLNFNLKNESAPTGVDAGEVDVQPQQSADGVSWANLGTATVMVRGGEVSIQVAAELPNIRILVTRHTGSTALGIVKGILAVPDWYAGKLKEAKVPLYAACKTACQNDCELGCQVTCEATAQTLP